MLTKFGQPSRIVKRSVTLHGHHTSVSLENEFWEGLREIAAALRSPLYTLIAKIDTERVNGNLSSAIRLFVLEHYRSQR